MSSPLDILHHKMLFSVKIHGIVSTVSLFSVNNPNLIDLIIAIHGYSFQQLSRKIFCIGPCFCWRCVICLQQFRTCCALAGLNGYLGHRTFHTQNILDVSESEMSQDTSDLPKKLQNVRTLRTHIFGYHLSLWAYCSSACMENIEFILTDGY